MKSKSYQKLASSRNSIVSIENLKFKSECQSSRGLKLQELRKRKLLNEPEVNNQVAAKVVKEYLLPMFESKFRNKSSNDRQKVYGFDHRRSLSIVPGTVYDELKLIENLSEENKHLRAVLDSLHQENRELMQEKESVSKELQRKNEEILNLTISLELISDENRHLARTIQKLHQKLAFGHDREISKRIQSQISLENMKFKQDLQDFKSKNDIRLFLSYFFNSFTSAH
jgi:hypothetical protein